MRSCACGVLDLSIYILGASTRLKYRKLDVAVVIAKAPKGIELKSRLDGKHLCGNYNSPVGGRVIDIGHATQYALLLY